LPGNGGPAAKLTPTEKVYSNNRFGVVKRKFVVRDSIDVDTGEVLGLFAEGRCM
jgi:hypothetical protein